jgi:hypothetical protein
MHTILMHEQAAKLSCWFQTATGWLVRRAHRYCVFCQGAQPTSQSCLCQ